MKTKVGFTDDEFELLLAFIFENVKIIPRSYYEDFLDQCRGDISDPDDVPILATAISTNAEGIWTHDPHFLEQKKVKVLTNIDLLNMSRS